MLHVNCICFALMLIYCDASQLIPFAFCVYVCTCLIRIIFQEAGMKKLNIMQIVASYRRRVQYYQWKFDTLKMKLEDMNAYIRTIEKCVVSRICHCCIASQNNKCLEIEFIIFIVISYFFFTSTGKVTKEIQQWLRQKQDGRIEDTSRQTERNRSNRQQANTENSL